MPRKRAAVHRNHALIEQLTSVLHAPFDDALSRQSSVRVMAIFYRGGHWCSRVVETVVEKRVVESG